MPFAAFALGFVLTAQAAADLPAQPPVVARAVSSNRFLPPEVVEQSLTLPPGCMLAGQPLSLVTVLASTPERQQQIELTHAYWRLAEAVAEYRFCWLENRQIAALQADASEAAALRLAKASSAATLQDAEAEAVAAQQELAALMALPLGAHFPLPADRPHVGPYHTYFKENVRHAARPGTHAANRRRAAATIQGDRRPRRGPAGGRRSARRGQRCADRRPEFTCRPADRAGCHAARAERDAGRSLPL